MQRQSLYQRMEESVFADALSADTKTPSTERAILYRLCSAILSIHGCRKFGELPEVKYLLETKPQFATQIIDNLVFCYGINVNERDPKLTKFCSYRYNVHKNKKKYEIGGDNYPKGMSWTLPGYYYNDTQVKKMVKHINNELREANSDYRAEFSVSKKSREYHVFDAKYVECHNFIIRLYNTQVAKDELLRNTQVDEDDETAF